MDGGGWGRWVLNFKYVYYNSIVVYKFQTRYNSITNLCIIILYFLSPLYNIFIKKIVFKKNSGGARPVRPSKSALGLATDIGMMPQEGRQ